MNRLSLRLSLISAWLRLASPLMTLMKSNTTRRSQPMIRSRLRSPTSKSITTVLWPRNAKPAAKAAAVVVLPTPPLPEVMTTTFAKIPPFACVPVRSVGAISRGAFSGATRPIRNPNVAQRSQGDQASISGDGQPVIHQGDLHRRSLVLGRQLLADKIASGDADQFGLEARTEDS